MQRALVLFYSQAGQTETAVEKFSRGLAQGRSGEPIGVDVVRLRTREEFRFPWTFRSFFRAFPRCVRGLTPELEPLHLDWTQYDLIVLGYQVWFLSPSLPMQAFLKSEAAGNLRGKPVLTLLTCRNLWHSALSQIQAKLSAIGANFLGQITVCELSPVWASFITTPRWMLTGKKGAFAFFPQAGISDAEFEKLEASGRAIARSWPTCPPELFGSNLNSVSLLLMDRIGYRVFRIWAAIFSAIAPREGLWQDALLLLFRVNLVSLILLIAPWTVIFEIWVRNDVKWLTRLDRRQGQPLGQPLGR